MRVRSECSSGCCIEPRRSSLSNPRRHAKCCCLRDQILLITDLLVPAAQLFGPEAQGQS